MKKSISIVTIAALFAVGSAFAGRYQQEPTLQWNIDHPEQGTPVVIFLTATQVKNLYCPSINNLECAYQVGVPSNIIKKP